MEATSSLCAGGPQDQGRERSAPIEEEDGQAFTGLAKATVLMRFRNRPESVTGHQALITARRMTSGELLKQWKGFRVWQL